MSKYMVPNTNLKEFCDALTSGDVEKLKTEIGAPAATFEDIFVPIDFLIVIHNLENHNPYEFDSALQLIRPDLVNTARLFSWLSRESSGDFKESISMKSFVEFLKDKIYLRDWKRLLQANDLSFDEFDFVQMSILCLENDIIAKDLIKLRSAFHNLKRKELSSGLEPFIESFSKMNGWDFGADFFYETQKVVSRYLRNELPPEIRAKGKEFEDEYKKACSEGSQPMKFFRLMIVGPEGVGKTSLLKALRGQPFMQGEPSTDFIEKIDITITDLNKDWSQCLSFKDQLKETRDDSVAQITVHNFKKKTEATSSDAKKHSSTNLEETVNVQDADPVPSRSVRSKSSEESVPTETTLVKSDPNEKTGAEFEPAKSVSVKFVRKESGPVDFTRIKAVFGKLIPKESVPVKPARAKPNYYRSDDSEDDEPSPVKSKLHSYKHSKNLPVEHIQEHWDREITIDQTEFFTVWDLAGQSYLFCMHSMFLTPKAVYIIPIDLSVNLDDPINLREKVRGRPDKREMKEKKYLDIILYWIQTIYSVATSAENDEGTSRIIVVFTKSDLVANPRDEAEKSFKKITDNLTQKSNCMSIVEGKYCIVSAKERNENFEQLKELIEKNAESTRFDFPLPIRWLDFALTILSQPNSVIGQEEIKKISGKLNCEDSRAILQFFHSIGMFFYRKNILVKSLSNFLDIILRIVSPQSCLDLNEFPKKLSQDVTKAERDALLTEDLLNLILSKNNLLEVKSEVVELLEEFGVILYKHGKPQQYYIPYLFTKELESIYKPKTNDLILYLYFPDNLVPTAFYFAFLSLCTKIYCGKNSKPNLAFDCLKFQFEDTNFWIIDFTEKQPYIRVILQRIKDIPLSSDIYSLIFQLEEWIVHIQQDLILSGKMTKIVLECPCKKFREILSPCIYFETYQKRSNVDETHFYCKNKQKYLPWTNFDQKLHSTFKVISRELGQCFVAEKLNDIVEHLDFRPLLKSLYKKGLINGEELAQINRLKVGQTKYLLDHFPNKGNDWAKSFYEALLESDSENNKELRKIFDLFISDYLKSEIPEDKHIGFTRYPISHNPCGICLIINNENFESDKLRKRNGSQIDCDILRETFENMNFLIRFHGDLAKSPFLKVLEDLRKSDHKDFDIFFCVIMSHGGDDDIICTKDGLAIKIDDILSMFTADKCASLSGKPKVFLIQACRGSSKDRGAVDTSDTRHMPNRQHSVDGEQNNAVPNRTETDAQPSPKVSRKVAIRADFYVAQATVKGYESYRSRKTGSIFINSFCSVLKTERFYHHLADIMLKVRRSVSMPKVRDCIQCSESTDTLSKHLYLF